MRADFAALVLACLPAVFAACLLGSTPMEIERVLMALLGRGDPADQLVVVQIRLPWAITGALAGTALIAFAALRTASAVTLILIGVGLSSFAGAAMNLMMNLAPNPFSLADMINWMLGSVANRSFPDLAFAAPFLVVGIGLLFVTRRGLSALTSGEVWRVLTYIPGISRDTLENNRQAREAGALLGRFHSAVSDLDHTFSNPRLGVHDTAAHLENLRRALACHGDHRNSAESNRLPNGSWIWPASFRNFR